MEFYLGTIPFRPDPSACTLHVQVVPKTGQGSSFRVDIKDKAFTAPNEVAEALSAEIAVKLRECDANASMEISYCKRGKRFLVKNKSRLFTVRLETNEASILAKLGFTTNLPLELGPDSEIRADSDWEIGNHDQPGGRSLEDQRIRDDPGFTELRARFNRQFGPRGGKQRRGKNISTPTENDRQPSVALHDGHLLLAEYLFSLVCLSMFRQEGLTMRMRSPGIGSETDNFLDELVTEDCLDSFDTRLGRVCRFNVGTKGDPCFCDIHSVVDFVKQAYVSAAREELKDNPHDDRSCLRYILREKLKASAVAENTSAEYSWFNETDRVLRDLLRGDSDRGHGRMVVMRVYEREEQLSMQHCLRQARRELLLHDGPTERPLFSVVCDNGDTNLSQDIEEYFRDSFNVQDDAGGVSTLGNRMVELRKLPGSRNTSLSYEDLLNVPMILILCEKGRMGDTFPHSLGCFDLRLRVAGYFSSFEQELGRLCRYPAFRKINGGSGPSREDAMSLGCEVLDRKRLVKVSTPAGILSVADTWWLLESIIASIGADDVITLEESVFPLPTALVPSHTMGKLLKAVEEHRLTNTPISKCIRMAKMDLHMIGSTNIKKKPNTETENALHNYSAYRPAEKHFDHRRGLSERKDPRRLILSAECQIGKTGVYLDYLSKLTNATTASCSEIVPCPPPVEDGWPREELSWLLPHWRTLIGIAPMSNEYSTLLASKYTEGIVRERIHLVRQSCCEGNRWRDEYAALLVDSCGEHVRSVIGNQYIEALRQRELVPPFNTEGDPTPAPACFESLKEAINWDGRFEPGLGVQFCACESQCTCAMAGDAYGKGLTLQLADLTRAGGEHGRVDERWNMPQDGDEGPAAKDAHVRKFAAKQPPCNWANGEAQGNLSTCTFRHPREPESGHTFSLHVSIPTEEIGVIFFNPKKTASRWIFTPSYNRAASGPRQAVLDRSVALQQGCDPPDVGTRFHINVLVVRWEQFALYRRHFGHQYVVLAMPGRMPCFESEGGYCSAEEGGIGYARHFIQQWSSTRDIPFVWMLDDNVQMCHELDVDTGEYNPCGFTHVMDSLERILMLPDSTNIVVNTAQQSVSKHAASRTTCPPDLESLRGQTVPGRTMHLTTVAGFCGKPDHYGVLGISRHGLGGENTKPTTTPFGVNHSVYSFCLLNVRSTVKQRAYYPMKRYWEDVEFNHIVDEKGLVVCMFRKFSHSKKNLQPPHLQGPLLCPPFAFEHGDIGLDVLEETYEKVRRGSTMVIPTDYLNSLLKYLSCHVLGSIYAEAIAYPSDRRRVILVDTPFEVLPTVPEQGSPRIELQTVPNSQVFLIMLLGGVKNQSLGLLKHVLTDKLVKQQLKEVVVVTRLPQRDGSTGNHIGEWLQEFNDPESVVEVGSKIVKPKGGRLGHGLLVLSFSSTSEHRREDENKLMAIRDSPPDEDEDTDTDEPPPPGSNEVQSQPPPRKRAKKDAPRAAMSAVVHFSQAKFAETKAENLDMEDTEIGIVLGEKWRGVDENIKAQFQRIADDDLKRYEKELIDYMAINKAANARDKG
ncbi:conserved unknown protein [Ectocarpus siliculosus]|uniref:HMG box domain-containing protein n=1 Tax=Ectocarpus siliculosus TaxID=2880 RepID=D7FUQ0_ECTSI|nr:conserved unknown protein [Ectocarpus siliculosus]|eukprot:CBJ31706.1 conserved unknown protein [Ectocarpus siliculosus]